ncbi:MAG: peptidoglycan-associated lipoprotein Pal [Leptothrix sp. (in: b-proteobacteria)]
MSDSNRCAPIRRVHLALAAGLVALTLAGCASKVRLDPPAPVENISNPSSTVVTPPGGSGAQTSGTSQSRVVGVDLSGNGGVAGQGADAAAAGSNRVVYFALDSYVVRDEDRGVIDSNARWLNADRKRAMLLEGHTDERGGSEYNLALGQRRAEAVARALVLLGVKDSQLESVSYGKEHPAVAGSNEAAWARNRRVELKEQRR